MYHFSAPRPSCPVLHLIERIVAPLGLRVDATSPWVDARLPGGDAPGQANLGRTRAPPLIEELAGARSLRLRAQLRVLAFELGNPVAEDVELLLVVGLSASARRINLQRSDERPIGPCRQNRTRSVNVSA